MCPPRETPTPSYTEQDLLKTFLELQTPPGYRAELINREIVVVPPPSSKHENIIGRISRAVSRSAPENLIAVGNKGLITPRGRFIPDLTVAPDDAYTDESSWSHSRAVELVCEITSSDPRHDRESKRLGYAQAGIPLYLLVDRDREMVVLFSEPDEDDYRITATVPFGKKLDLPKPFELSIDTGEFL